MLYYPLAVLMQAEIRDILVIVPPDDEENFMRLLGDGRQFGLNISYKKQMIPRGIADAFMVGEDFIGNDDVCLILGDNLFYSENLPRQLLQARELEAQGHAVIFGCYSDHPQDFGVVEFDASGKVLSIEEKPAQPKSNYIVPGLYFYDSSVIEIAKKVEPSARGELEITSVNNAYLEEGKLQVIALEEPFYWFDAGTEVSLLETANTVKEIEDNSGHYVACPEEIAFQKGWISKEKLQESAEKLKKTRYAAYLNKILSENA